MTVFLYRYVGRIRRGGVFNAHKTRRVFSDSPSALHNIQVSDHIHIRVDGSYITTIIIVIRMCVLPKTTLYAIPDVFIIQNLISYKRHVIILFQYNPVSR